ncbi:MAG: xpsE [Gammaproteobacteria bacterium]|jgi:type IV pilus assembly protein PilB|nr:xpsE [Gammaproteobacteria bacterium]MCE3238995.1 xpsE [Gammaproteobacteria bacterium]
MTNSYTYPLTQNPASYLTREDLVDYIIQDAIQQAASDIHIEPFANACRIRYRCDGLLYETANIPTPLASRFITQLKVMAQLDITERRLPQDGHFQLNAIDVRINTCPTLFGEKIVLRLLNSHSILLTLSELGLNEIQKNILVTHLKKPQGMILVTGPTGSGKTITLYSAINYLNSIEKNISTIEDPIEIQLPGINQININPKIGLDFSTILRTVLRQDPDILMIGEIRDKETATLAIQAAQTGHLVLATLHTNSAIDTLTRLSALGINVCDIANCVSLIIAQRLVRKFCTYCKQEKNCPYCIRGYLGRIGVYEFLPITEKIAELILIQANLSTLRQQMQNEGFPTLYESGMEKVKQGITCLNEINRIL